MSGIPFHETRAGHRFLEHTMPRLVDELAKLNRNLAELVEVARARDAQEREQPPSSTSPDDSTSPTPRR